MYRGPCKYRKDGERQRKTSKDAERRQKKSVTLSLGLHLHDLCVSVCALTIHVYMNQVHEINLKSDDMLCCLRGENELHL